MEEITKDLEQSLLEMVDETTKGIGEAVSLDEMQKGATEHIRTKQRASLVIALDMEEVPEDSIIRLAVLGIFDSTETSFAFSKKDINKLSKGIVDIYMKGTNPTVKTAVLMFARDVLMYFFQYQSVYFFDLNAIELITKLYARVNAHYNTIDTLTDDDARDLFYRAVWSTRLKDPNMLMAAGVSQMDVLYRKDGTQPLSAIYDGPTLLAAYLMRKILHNDILFLPIDADPELGVVVKEYTSMFYALYYEVIEPLFLASEQSRALPADQTKEEFNAAFEEFTKTDVANNVVIEVSATIMSEILSEMIKFAIDIRFKLDMVDIVKVLLVGLYNETYDNQNQEDIELLVETVVDAIDLPELFDSYGDNIFTIEDIVKEMENVPE